ncbi:Pimeloyl-ACP methyl ester carboxylesterase [Amycolatopsis pretoriensis]|uniref:Pimeloyl-ACP methyl ester carboxylesterase n=1 Tax=Amycolatopsis pretoriensis TaxID=218821 RepID=A0A1H5Q854_9PSEU|nr:alpha/beta fold hydrolase [Amycolatopsis pretoriensis]SEF22293.1 Pimeloyl-ACP methyl ester carboxylesterase [Amycolatopsis pretoriensis]
MGEIELGDGFLSYEEHGRGRPLVFLHAGGMNRAMWDEQFARFARDHRVIRYDARGSGDSSNPPAPPGLYSHYEDLRKLLDALDVEHPVLVGCSFGSRVFLDFAVAHPGRAAGLFLSSPGISGMEFRDPYIVALQAEQTEAANAGDGAKVLECLLRMWVDGPHRQPADVDPAVRQFCQAMVVENFVKGHGAPDLGVELGAIRRVAEIRDRALLVTGDLDSTDIFAVADLVDRKAPHARRARVPGAAHMVNLEQPARFDALLREFLHTC